MKRLLLVLLPLALATGLYVALDGDGPTSAPPPEAEPTAPEVLPGGLEDPAAEERHRIRARLKSGTLVVRVRTPDGSVPTGTEVGYRHRGETRWLYVDAQGSRAFHSAPLGQYQALARAPGHPMQEQEVIVQKGLQAEVIIVLKPGS